VPSGSALIGAPRLRIGAPAVRMAGRGSSQCLSNGRASETGASRVEGGEFVASGLPRGVKFGEKGSLPSFLEAEDSRQGAESAEFAYAILGRALWFTHESFGGAVLSRIRGAVFPIHASVRKSLGQVRVEWVCIVRTGDEKVYN
jgi:hypothetical protein